ncbi:MAG: hypothetical protein GX354_07360 [Firmicutes bacterium]|jgi:hypothetical protein|nr:hypothetical protein [Bacillota bacterium]
MGYRLENHVHPYIGPTEVALEHIHQLAGSSGPAIPAMGGHIHRIAGLTTTDREHSHAYSIYSGPPVHVCHGQHVHHIEGNTTTNNDHDHGVQLETGTQEPCGCPEYEEMHCMGMEYQMGMGGESW